MTSPEIRSVRLMKLEYSQFFLILPPIATVTYYRGPSPESFLRQRVFEILEANPWLAGSLLTATDGLRLQYSIPPYRECFYVERDYDSLAFPENDSAAYDILDDRLLSLLPKPAGDILNDEREPLFKVLLLCIAEDKFAVLCAMNHVIADGHTYYAIHRMLSEDAVIKPMIVDRYEEALRYSEQYPYVLGAYGRSWAFVVNAIVSAIMNAIFRSLKSAVSLISPAAVQRIKQSLIEAGPPISTNDIITSAFFRATHCDIGLMAMNLRPRVPDLTDLHAGNYETVLVMRSNDFESPVSVRKVVDAVNQRTISPSKFPGFWRTLFSKFTVISNWATFYHDVRLKNCELIRHHPVLDFTKGCFETCFIFRSRAIQLAIAATTMRQSSVKREILGYLECES